MQRITYKNKQTNKQKNKEESKSMMSVISTLVEEPSFKVNESYSRRRQTSQIPL